MPEAVSVPDTQDSPEDSRIAPDFSFLEEHIDRRLAAHEAVDAVARRYATLLSEEQTSPTGDEARLADLQAGHTAALHELDRLPGLSAEELTRVAAHYAALRQRLSAA
ncbi:hypothetical protein ABT095_37740 [Kitasatospora sp. NPDC002227]|uniref:hypothetical protein n=1 Tax=Kitasatospora sp. NPDC002227 TaxID=3154773 RepID=UPI00332864C9